nr:replicative DNA helicase [Deinococcus arboris]
MGAPWRGRVSDFDGSTLGPRVPPHHRAAEVSVLGSVLLDPDLVRNPVLVTLNEEDFYLESHRLIWRAIGILAGQEIPADLTTLSAQLTRTGDLDNAGGLTYLMGLADEVPTAAYAEHYGRIVLEHAHRRALIRHAGTVMRHAYAGDMALEDIHTLATIPPALEFGEDDQSVAVGDAMRQVLHEAETGTGSRGVSTGLKDLDGALGGLQPGRLYVVAARPAMGKSALGFQVAAYVAKSAGRVLGFSIEMPATEISARLLAAEAKVNMGRLGVNRIGDAAPGEALTERDRQRLRASTERLADLPFRILSKSSLRLQELIGEVRRAHAREPLKLFILDYIQLVQVSGRSADNATARVTEVTTALKSLALELNIPVIALSQLNRGVEQRADRRPIPSDLRDSGSIEQDADVIVFIYRDEVYNPQTDQQGVAELIIGKNRSGPIATVKVTWQAPFVRFDDLAYRSSHA